MDSQVSPLSEAVTLRVAEPLFVVSRVHTCQNDCLFTHRFYALPT